MGGGAVSGNSVASSSVSLSDSPSGGGVYVDGGTFAMSGGAVSGNSASASVRSAYGGGVFVDGGTFAMSGGAVSDNSAIVTSMSTSSGPSYGGGVYVDGGTFTMSGGVVSGNSAARLVYSSGNSVGGGVYVDGGGILIKQKGAIIYGSNESDSALRNTAVHNGHAVIITSIAGSVGKALNSTAGTDIVLDSNLSSVAGGWNPPSNGISDIAYSSVSGDTWTLESDGRHKSPAIDNNSITKMRVSFTSTEANADITITLDVSSSGGNMVFISALDNDSSDGDYPDGPWSGIGIFSRGVTVTVPTAGSHFIDIGFQSISSQHSGLDCAWFKVE
jgi:hypothetical protein